MPRNAYHHGDLRRALLATARRQLERDGPNSSSLRGMAREAGVSPAAPYYHFDDRDALLAALASQGFEELGHAMSRTAQAATKRGRLDHLQAAGVAYVCFAVKNPELFRLMFSGLLGDRSAYPELQRSAAETFGVLQRLIGGTREGPRSEFPPPAAMAAWSAVHGLATLLIDGRLGEVPTERQAARIAREVTQVLGPGLRILVRHPRSSR